MTSEPIDFSETTRWSVTIPKPVTYAGDVIYREGSITVNFWWEATGTDSPHTLISPPEFPGPIPDYVFQRVAQEFRAKFFKGKNTIARLVGDSPPIIHILMERAEN